MLRRLQRYLFTKMSENLVARLAAASPVRESDFFQAYPSPELARDSRSWAEMNKKADQPGQCATSPWQMPAAPWKRIAARTWQRTWIDNVGLVAAGVAFYGFLAFVPLLGLGKITDGLC